MKRLTFFLLILLVLPLAFAASPFESEEFKVVDTGLEIAYPEIRFIKAGTTIEFDFHVFNATNGLPITNTTAECYFQLNNNVGNHIYEINATNFAEPFDFTVTIDGNNFTEGDYFYTFQCNTTSAGGFVEENVRVTSDGEDREDSTAIMIVITFFGSLFIVLGSVMLLRRRE